MKKSQPNKNIVFIKPRPGPDEVIARDYLERIAAQCAPIMKNNYLSVVSLEEYQPNLEFWGRNFNNGEVIQLVLKSPTTGRWLPFRFVQMVMMHELAHCKEMNHSKAFWKVRYCYTEEMKALWEQKYTGDGLWGRGVLLENGAFDGGELAEGEVLPEHMCGGTFRSKGRRKRKVKPKITYKEAKERRIRRKFGVNGVALGADEDTKVKLEKGKRPIGKPRVAGSMRGRELRAAAALARFDVKKEEPEIKDEELVTDSEGEDEYEDEPVIKAEPSDALDINGERLLDSKGNAMVKVCESETQDDDDARQELLELQRVQGPTPTREVIIRPTNTSDSSRPADSSGPPKYSTVAESQLRIKSEPKDDNVLPPSTTVQALKDNTAPGSNNHTAEPIDDPSKQTKRSTMMHTATSAIAVPTVDEVCQVCSVENSPESLTCTVCANVLRPDFVVGSWSCASGICQESKYINAGDVALCGVCGGRRAS